MTRRLKPLTTGPSPAPLTANGQRPDPAPVPVSVLTGDPDLLEHLRQLAAAAGVELQVPSRPGPGTRWPPGLVLLGVDEARAALQQRPPPAPVPRSGTSSELLLVTTANGRARAASDDGHDAWRCAVLLGADQVAVLPDARDWLVERMARTVEPVATAHAVGVLGGCGGAGASVLAAAMARCAAGAGRRTLLIDLDPLGGGLDLAVGLDDVPGLRWPDLLSARGRLPSSSLHDSLPRAGSMAVLGWGRGEPLDVPVAAVDAVLDAAVRGHDVVVVDLPRTIDPACDSALRRLDDLLVVVPSRLRSVVAASQVVASLGGRSAPPRVVVRRVPGERWSAQQVASALGLPLAAQMRDEPRLDGALGRREPPAGRSRGVLHAAAEQCLAWRPSGTLGAGGVA